MKFRPLPIMTGCALVSLVILFQLGQWQYTRYSDKIDLDPTAGVPTEQVAFRVAAAPGTSAQQVYGIADSEPIWRRYVVAMRSDTQSPVLLAIGATGGANPVPLPIEDMAIEAIDVRVFPRAGRVSARNRPEADTWYVFDRSGMQDRLGWAGPELPVAEPVDLKITNADNPLQHRVTVNPYGTPIPADPLPPQRHLGYALTWWGLAAALFVMYFVYHASVGRLSWRGSA